MGQLASGGDLLARKVLEKLKGFVALLPDHYALASTYKCTKSELNPLARPGRDLQHYWHLQPS